MRQAAGVTARRDNCYYCYYYYYRYYYSNAVPRTGYSCYRKYRRPSNRRSAGAPRGSSRRRQRRNERWTSLAVVPRRKGSRGRAAGRVTFQAGDSSKGYANSRKTVHKTNTRRRRKKRTYTRVFITFLLTLYKSPRQRTPRFPFIAREPGPRRSTGDGRVSYFGNRNVLIRR